MSDVRVMVILANDCEEGETTTIMDIMRRAGFVCDGVSIADEIVICQHGCRLLADVIMGEDTESYKSYDAMILPGGWGAADHMGEDRRVIELVKYFAETPDKYLAAMCAAPGVLARAGVTKGKIITSYPGPKLEPLFTDAEYVTDAVAFDDNKHLITSRGPATVLPFAFAIVDALGGDSTFIKQRFLYNVLKEYPDGI
ncbi:MAG: DJ-1/PfpI family protein [Lachnospiraceae bacterium]|nr:DJ-1/PfpI family protein [Lachnospiraceae bacterium]